MNEQETSEKHRLPGVKRPYLADMSDFQVFVSGCEFTTPGGSKNA